MSIFNQITKGRIKKPLFCCLYSGPGVGKTDFGSSFPKPLFFDFEESTHNIDVERIDNLRSWEDIINGLTEILESNTDLGFKSIIFDTIDELERLMHVYVAQQASKATIEHIGWQKGYDHAVNLWAEFISICRQIRDKHKIHFCFLCHSIDKAKTEFEKQETFTRHQMNLHKKAAAFLFGQVEMVLFAKKEVSFRKDSDGNTFAKDLDKRVLCASLSAHYDAKNRVGLPATMPMPVRNGFDVLWGAYNTAFDETPDHALKKCLAALEKVKDKIKAKSIYEYIKKFDQDIAVLRSSLIRINEIIGDQNESV